ncbi:MAG: DUF1579 domain-containing protein [Planctomycetales bacterium]|nr:DUF1579 domain-containing protein [Planctomycetales bacterium]
MSRSLRWLAVALVATTATIAIAQTGMFPPTPAHRQMAREAGVWEADVKMWMAPEDVPMSSQAVETNEMLGDYWLESKFEGEFGGQKFVGKGMTGYDPAAKKFVGTWCDTMTPYLTTTEGDYDVETHTLTMMGASRDPATGEMTKSKITTKYVDDDAKVMTMYGPVPDEDGQWWKMMEITYKRKK